MSHSMDVPDWIWQWALERSGRQKRPTKLLRELLSVAVIQVIQAKDPDVKPDLVLVDNGLESQWRLLNCAKDQDGFPDATFAAARDFFVEKWWGGDELAAIEFLKVSIEHRGLLHPRAFIVSWYREHKQAS